MDEHDRFADAYSTDPLLRDRFLSGWRAAANGYERIMLGELVGLRMEIDPARAAGWDCYTRVIGPLWWRRHREDL